MTKKKTPPPSPPAALPLEALMGRDLSNAVVFFHETVAACVDMNVTEWKCLGLLDQHGPLPASRLAELSGFTTGAITGIVDRLERAGYVRREAHPTDRRSTIVQPLAARQIRERVSPIFQSLAKSMTKLAGKFTAAELSAISAFMTETTEILRAETARLKSEDVKKSCKV
jgi:DNA-binding MarR family transcriptional regulator